MCFRYFYVALTSLPFANGWGEQDTLVHGAGGITTNDTALAGYIGTVLWHVGIVLGYGKT